MSHDAASAPKCTKHLNSTGTGATNHPGNTKRQAKEHTQDQRKQHRQPMSPKYNQQPIVIKSTNTRDQSGN